MTTNYAYTTEDHGASRDGNLTPRWPEACDTTQDEDDGGELTFRPIGEVLLEVYPGLFAGVRRISGAK